MARVGIVKREELRGKNSKQGQQERKAESGKSRLEAWMRGGMARMGIAKRKTGSGES